ncbi:tetratricopeptide repeat protein [Ekhidna sp. MALMAid0563]|uniref:tetratricopeptide repeat protein n=1 Tax=Ekhidna sp. MALMAid0563 TaxID=3143937 RepID=UPI0032DE8768
MKAYFLLSAILLSSFGFANDVMESKLKSIYEIMRAQPDSAISIANNLKNISEESDDYYGIVKINFTLGYIYDILKRDYGKGIIYYLEAIRYAKKSSYDDVNKDLTILHKNCGVIFRKFKSYSLAEEYYNIAITYAHLIESDKEIQSINFNLAGLMMDEKRYEEAILILNDLIDKSEVNSKNYWKYSNRLGLALFESGHFEMAIEAHDNSLNNSDISDELRAYTLNNIGRCLSSLQQFEDAVSYFNQAIEIKKELKDKSVLFSTYCELGELNLKTNKFNESLKYLNLAEAYVDQVDNVKNFDLFKLKADALFKIKEYHKAKKYEDLYSENLNKYLDLQEQIQESDRRYNMDLITKRYFDEVAKQERIASILFYSKLISGSLLALLLFSVGYNWYQKVRMRRSIVRELVDLKIID